MQIVTLDQIRSMISMPEAIEAVRQSFIDISNGLIDQPEPMQILFHDDANELVGDCHTKAARSKDKPYFTIKIATGFYRNPERGLPQMTAWFLSCLHPLDALLHFYKTKAG